MPVTLVNPKTPGAVDIDFTDTEGATRTVEGTFADLVRDGHDCTAQWMNNVHADPKERKPAFLVGRGWSATPERRRMISEAGIPIMAVNDYPTDAPAPRYWCTGDPPHYFTERIWTNPDVMKFCGHHNRNGVRPRDGAYEPRRLVKEAPNTFFFHQATNETDVEHWLFHPFIVWGTNLGGEDCPKQFYSKGAARSSMLIGLKLLWFLGYRRVYLLGCDCTPHHHDAPEYWNTIFYLLNQIAPSFKKWGFEVHQTNPDSYLRTFPITPFKELMS